MGTYYIYKDVQNQWRWRYVASNGKTIAVSSEAYWHKSDCRASVEIMRNSGSSPVVEQN